MRRGQTKVGGATQRRLERLARDRRKIAGRSLSRARPGRDRRWCRRVRRPWRRPGPRHSAWRKAASARTARTATGPGGRRRRPGSDAPDPRRSRRCSRPVRGGSAPTRSKPLLKLRIAGAEHRKLRAACDQSRHGIGQKVEPLLPGQPADHGEQRRARIARKAEALLQRGLVRRPRRPAIDRPNRRGDPGSVSGFQTSVSMPLRMPLSTVERDGAAVRRGRSRCRASGFPAHRSATRW